MNIFSSFIFFFVFAFAHHCSGMVQTITPLARSACPQKEYLFSLPAIQKEIKQARAYQDLLKLMKEQILWAYYCNERIYWDADCDYDDYDLGKYCSTPDPSNHTELLKSIRAHQKKLTTALDIQTMQKFLDQIKQEKTGIHKLWEQEITTRSQALQKVDRISIEQINTCLNTIKDSSPADLIEHCKLLRNAAEKSFNLHYEGLKSLQGAFVLTERDALANHYQEWINDIITARQELSQQIQYQTISNITLVWMLKLSKLYKTCLFFEEQLNGGVEQPGVVPDDVHNDDKFYHAAGEILSYIARFLQDLGFYQDPRPAKSSRAEKVKALLNYHAYLFASHFETKIFSSTLAPERIRFLRMYAALINIKVPTDIYTLVAMQPESEPTAPLGSHEKSTFSNFYDAKKCARLRFISEPNSPAPASDTESPTPSSSEPIDFAKLKIASPTCSAASSDGESSTPHVSQLLKPKEKKLVHMRSSSIS